MTKDIKWVDIDDKKKQEVKFYPLNIVNEKTTPKIELFNRDLCKLVQIYRNGFIHESKLNNTSGKFENLKNTNSWKDFQNKG